MKVNGGESNELIRQAEMYQSVKTKSIEEENVKQAEKNQYNLSQKLTISDEAKKLHEIVPKLDEIPDIREDKVAEIKKQIDEGTYKISGEKVAEKILKNFGI